MSLENYTISDILTVRSSSLVLPNPIGTVGLIGTGGTARTVDTNSSGLNVGENPRRMRSLYGILDSILLAMSGSIS